jgi:hypothetical protein
MQATDQIVGESPRLKDVKRDVDKQLSGAVNQDLAHNLSYGDSAKRSQELIGFASEKLQFIQRWSESK